MTGVNSLFISSRSIAEVPQGAPRHVNQRSPRFYYWLAFFLFSLIVVGASIEASDRVHSTSRGVMNQKWAVSCSFVSFGVATVVVVMHLVPICTIFIVNTKLEGIVAVVMIALWSALVAAISDSNNGLAVDGEGGVVFGNLYYCGWGGFICAILLFLNYLKEVYFIQASEEMALRSDRLNLWLGCMISSIVLTAAASNIFDHECLGSERYGTKFCNRSLLALVDGATGCGFSIIIMGMKFATGVSPWGVELALSVVLFLVNCFSMGLVTAEDGPGAKIGNLFYFSWFTLILAAMLMSATIDYIVKGRQKDDERVVDAYEQPRYAAVPPQTQQQHHIPPPQPTKTIADYYPIPGVGGQSVAPTEYSSAPSRYGADDATHATERFNDESQGARSYRSQGTRGQQSFYSRGGGASVASYGGGYASEYGDDAHSEMGSVAKSNYGDPPVKKDGGFYGEHVYQSNGAMSAGMSYASGLEAGARSSASGMDLRKPKTLMNDESSMASEMDDSLGKPTKGSFV